MRMTESPAAIYSNCMRVFGGKEYTVYPYRTQGTPLVVSNTRDFWNTRAPVGRIGNYTVLWVITTYKPQYTRTVVHNTVDRIKAFF